MKADTGLTSQFQICGRMSNDGIGISVERKKGAAWCTTSRRIGVVGGGGNVSHKGFGSPSDAANGEPVFPSAHLRTSYEALIYLALRLHPRPSLLH